MIENDNFLTEELTTDLQKKYCLKFDCGNSSLSSFLKSTDALNKSIGKTYILMNEYKNVMGYYNISTGDIVEVTDSREVRIGGSIHINCFAVDANYQKLKYDENAYISDIILADCINRIELIRNQYLGFEFVTLSSTKEGYYLYKRNGFFDIENDMKIAKNPGELTCMPMYLPLDYE